MKQKLESTMKRFTYLPLAVLVALSPLTLRAANTAAGFVDFGKLSPAGEDGQFVEVNINSNLISMVARLAHKAEPEMADMLQGLKAIRVNVLSLNDENREDIASRIKTIRTQLDAGGWERIVTAQEKSQDVGVYLKTRGEEAVEGVVVTVLDGKKQAVLINVVGDIRPEQLGILGERFNIEPLKNLGPKEDTKEEKKAAKHAKKKVQKEHELEQE